MKQKVLFLTLLILLTLGSGNAWGQDTNVCYGSDVELSLSTTRPQWSYRWQKKQTTDTSSNWTTFGTGAAATLSAVTEGWDVQCVSDSAATAGGVVYAITVNPYAPLTPARIAAAGGTTICHATLPPTLAVSDTASGGGGDYSYQWQYVDNGSAGWTPIEGATETSWTETAGLVADREYRVVTASLCDTSPSNEVLITVMPDLDAGSIDAEQTVCHAHAATIHTLAPPSGVDGNLTRRWQLSADNVNWTDVAPEETGANLTTPALTTDMYYRVKAMSPTCSVAATTAPCHVHVLDPFVPGTIGGDTTVCHATAPHPLALLTPPTGGQTPYSYQWQRSSNGTTFHDIASETDPAAYAPGALTGETHYRLRQTESMGCGEVFSDTVTIGVFAPIAAAAMPDTLLCHHTSTTLYSQPSGGGNTYTYLWQQSTDGTLWIALTGETDSSLTTGPLDDTTYYRVVVSSTIPACSQATSQAVLVSVLPPFLPGTIVRDSLVDTVCYRTSPGTLSMAADATGDMGPGSYSYQWQQSTDSLHWFDIQGQTDTLGHTPEIRRKTLFRLAFLSAHACPAVYSAPVRFFVYDDDTAAATIFSLADNTTYCYDSLPLYGVKVQAYPSGATFSHQWQSYTDPEGWRDIAGQTADTLPPVALRETTRYRLVSTALYDAHSCPRFSNEVTFNIYPRIEAGIDYDTLLCHNRAATLHCAPSGGGDLYNYRWEKRVTSLEWTPVGTDSTYATGTLANANTTPRASFYYRVVVVSQKGCSQDTANVTVNVYPQLQPGTLAGTTDSVCRGLRPDYTIAMDRNARNGSGSYSYQWWVATGDAPYLHDTAFDGATVYSPDTLWETTHYKLRFVDNFGCDYAESAPHTVRVDPLPPRYTIGGQPTPCHKQWESYSLANASEAYSYHWETSSYLNRIDSTQSALNDRVEIYWFSPDSLNTITVTAVDRRTRCRDTSRRDIRPYDEEAPARTTIVHKPNSNILIAQEQGNLHYQWGYTDNHTGTQTAIPGANLRYVLLPMDFDSLRYDYWLELRAYPGSPCYSVSHYVGNGNLAIDDPDNPFGATLTVSPAGQRRLAVAFSPTADAATLHIYDLEGRLIHSQPLAPDAHSSNNTMTQSGNHTCTLVLPARGVYVVEALLKNGFRLIKKAVVF